MQDALQVKEVTFRRDATVLKGISSKVVQFMKEKKLSVYAAGHFELGPVKGKFLLTSVEGQPTLMFLAGGDLETSFVFLVQSDYRERDQALPRR